MKNSILYVKVLICQIFLFLNAFTSLCQRRVHASFSWFFTHSKQIRGHLKGKKYPLFISIVKTSITYILNSIQELNFRLRILIQLMQISCFQSQNQLNLSDFFSWEYIKFRENNFHFWHFLITQFSKQLIS